MAIICCIDVQLVLSFELLDFKIDFVVSKTILFTSKFSSLTTPAIEYFGVENCITHALYL